MLISRLLVKNYRCVGNKPLVVHLSESGLTALVGPNNIGKSTILKALDILLGDKWPMGQFDEDDFHDNDLQANIVIACEFAEPITVTINNTNYQSTGVCLAARYLQAGYGASSIDIDYSLIERIDDFDACKWKLARYGNNVPVRISQDARNALPLAITIPLIRLHSQQATNKWGVLGRMLQKVEATLPEDKQADFQSKMKDAVDILREPPEFQTIEGDVKGYWETMKPKNLAGTSLEFLDYEPWRYYRQFKLSIRREGRDVPLETLGEGVQRLAIIALYRTYLKNHYRQGKAILLVEEPESYLHPQARRSLFRVLKEAIDEGGQAEGQIVYTTHCEDFIDCGDFPDIVILGGTEDCLSARKLSKEALALHTRALIPLKTVSDQQIHYRLIETITQGLKEALFARKAVIVEGPSEIELLRFFTDVEREQIAVVAAGGKSNIPSVYSLLTAFGIPSLVMVDRDSKTKEKTEEENQRIAGMLAQSNARRPDATKIDVTGRDIDAVEDGEIKVIGRLLVFGKNLEVVLRAKLNRYDKLLDVLRRRFELPSDSKPRDLQSLGLAFRDPRSCGDEVSALIAEEVNNLHALSESLTSFVNREVQQPQLLRPNDAGGPEQFGFLFPQ